MNNKIFYKLCLLFFTLLFFGCGSKIKNSDERPNIVFFLIDDQRNDVLSIEGHPIVKTPTIDRLATSGVRFTNAFVTTSICAASRASIFTGLYESKHNFTFGKAPISKKLMVNSYPYLLKQAGYDTGFIGKFGIKMENERQLMSSLFNYIKMSPQSVPHVVELEDGSMRHSAEIKGDQAIEYIGLQSKDKPFCLSISFNAVHAVDSNLKPGMEGHYPYPQKVANLYEKLEMPKPLLSDPEIFNNHPEFLKKSMNRERYFWRWDNEEKYQKNIKAYYRMISGYDMVMNNILLALKKHGFDKNTIIIYASDNGYYMGNRGFAGKWSHYEESLRIPLIIYDPRNLKEKEEHVVDKIALNIDIPATILDYAEIPVPKSMQGKSLRRFSSDGPIDSWRTNFLIEHRMENNKIPKYVGLRNEAYVYANYYDQNPPYEFLHHLKTDPNQLTNLADDPRYSEVLLELRAACKKLEQEVK